MGETDNINDNQRFGHKGFRLLKVLIFNNLGQFMFSKFNWHWNKMEAKLKGWPAHKGSDNFGRKYWDRQLDFVKQCVSVTNGQNTNI